MSLKKFEYKAKSSSTLANDTFIEKAIKEILRKETGVEYFVDLNTEGQNLSLEVRRKENIHESISRLENSKDTVSQERLQILRQVLRNKQRIGS